MRRAALTVLLLSACRYQFVHPQGQLPTSGAQVWAPVFQNRTSEPGAEAFFTQAFREQLSRAGALGTSDAAATLEGTLESVSGTPLIASAGKLPSYRLSATLSLKLSEGGAQKATARVDGTEDYLSGADVLLTEANRQAALRRLAEVLARDGFEQLSQRW